MIPISNFLHDIKMHFSNKTSHSPQQKSKIKGNGNVVNLHVDQTPNLNEAQVESLRRNRLVTQLRQQWLSNNDGITSGRLAGLEWGEGEREWINEQLALRAEEWQV
jgi:hypothetical protein